MLDIISLLSENKLYKENSIHFKQFKTIVCQQIELPFYTGLPENYTFIKYTNNQLMININRSGDNQKSILLIYKFINLPKTEITSGYLHIINIESYQTINEICKTLKIRFGNMDVFMLHEGNKNDFETFFIVDNFNKEILNVYELDNIASSLEIEPIKPKQLFSSEYDEQYFIDRLNGETDDLFNSFYYFTLAKENEINKNFTSAVINIQTGLEIFFTELIKKLQREGHIKSYNVEKAGFKNNLDQHLNKCLTDSEYIFDTENEQSDLHEYWINIYEMRNDVVHRGHMVSFIDYHLQVRPTFDKLFLNVISQFNKKYPDIRIKIHMDIV